jgi:hypothetical protein
VFPRTEEIHVTEEQRDELKLEPRPAEPEAEDVEQDEKPDFELHGQFFDAPSE